MGAAALPAARGDTEGSHAPAIAARRFRVPEKWQLPLARSLSAAAAAMETPQEALGSALGGALAGETPGSAALPKTPAHGSEVRCACRSDAAAAGGAGRASRKRAASMQAGGGKNSSVTRPRAANRGDPLGAGGPPRCGRFFARCGPLEARQRGAAPPRGARLGCLKTHFDGPARCRRQRGRRAPHMLFPAPPRALRARCAAQVGFLGKPRGPLRTPVRLHSPARGQLGPGPAPFP